MKKPITINGQWKLFYSKFPKIYDKFSHYEDSYNKIFEFIKKEVDLHNKIILDVGAGTGRYSILFSKLAKKVYALEPSSEMREVLNQKVKKKNIRNICIINQKIQNFKLPYKSIHIIFSSWVLSEIYGWRSNISSLELKHRKAQIKSIIAIFKKISTKNGLIIVVETAPHQYGGQMQSIILGSSKDFSGNFTSWFAKEFNFKVVKKNTSFNFRSIAEAAEIFGFIYGDKVRKHILKKKIKNIKMRTCIMIKNIKN